MYMKMKAETRLLPFKSMLAIAHDVLVFETICFKMNAVTEDNGEAAQTLPTPYVTAFARWVLVMLLAGLYAVAASKTHSRAPAGSAGVVIDSALTRQRETVLNASPLAMFYYSSDALGMESLEAHADGVTVLAPQAYELDGTGGLHGHLSDRLLELTRNAGVPLMPLVLNPDFDRISAHRLLQAPAAQARAIRALDERAERDGYIGWQLDFENLSPADKLAYTRFVSRVALRLHRERRLLSVAVVPRFSDHFPDSTGPGFHTGEWGAAYDFRGLGRAVDFLTLMAYDQHTPLTPPGPVAGYDWVKAALEYAAQHVPPHKLLLGVPLYGREWVATSHGTTCRSIAYKDLKHYFDDPDSLRNWDDLFRTAWFKLQDGDEVHTAWFDDARSLREKLKLVQLYHLRGYAAWRLGVEDPEFWQAQGR